MVKNKREISKIRSVSNALAEIFSLIPDLICPGISTFELDRLIEKMITGRGYRPACKGYGGFPAAVCISLNDVVVHGIPRPDIIIKDGDSVKIDIVISKDGFYADMARAWIAGRSVKDCCFNLQGQRSNYSCSDLHLCCKNSKDTEINAFCSKTCAIGDAAQNSFWDGFEKVGPGVRLGDLSNCIQNSIEKAGFYVVREFAGHGIGRQLHEDPEILNYGNPGTGLFLREGMVLAIEPMLSDVCTPVVIATDGWSAKTQNGCITGHFENTVLITNFGCEVLTKL